jgi:dephospho-CoA kinase
MKRSDIMGSMNSNPIIIGLAGRAGSGKTSVAEAIVPKGSFSTVKYGGMWDHIFFALPLYEMATARINIQGQNEVSRRKYAIHDTLFDLYGRSPIGSIPNYDDLVDRVNKIYDLPITNDGVKPRSFLQVAGDICRDGYDDCFCKWAIYKSNKLYKDYLYSLEEDEEKKSFYVIISDVRYPNEADAILSARNGKLVFFDAEDETLNARLMKRDGRISSPEQLAHSSEQSSAIVKNMASIVISTDNMSIEDQVQFTLKELGINIQEQEYAKN